MKILKFPKTRTQKSNQPQNRKQKVAFQFGKPQKILPGFHEVWEVTDTSLLPQSHFIKPTTLEVNGDEDDSAPLNPNDSPQQSNILQQWRNVNKTMGCLHLRFCVRVPTMVALLSLGSFKWRSILINLSFFVLTNIT